MWKYLCVVFLLSVVLVERAVTDLWLEHQAAFSSASLCQVRACNEADSRGVFKTDGEAEQPTQTERGERSSAA